MLLYVIFAMIQFFLSKNPDLIFVMENPVGHMQNLPYIQMMIEVLNLKTVTVNYCQFGEQYKKPTHLWTNVRIFGFSFLLVCWPI
jgi:hypothetical protein